MFKSLIKQNWLTVKSLIETKTDQFKNLLIEQNRPNFKNILIEQNRPMFKP